MINDIYTLPSFIVSYFDTADALGDGSDTWVVKITVRKSKIISAN